MREVSKITQFDKAYNSVKRGDIVKIKAKANKWQRTRYGVHCCNGGDVFFQVVWKYKQARIAYSTGCSEVVTSYYIHLRKLSNTYKYRIGPLELYRDFTKVKNTNAVKILYG